MSNNKTPNFFEPRTVMAFALTIIVFVFWQNYMKKKYPHLYSAKSNQVKEQEVKSTGNLEINETITNEIENKVPKIIKNVEVSNSTEIPIVTKEEDYIGTNWSAKVSNQGLEFKEVILTDYKSRELKNVDFYNLFKTSFYGTTTIIPFEITKSDGVISGLYKSESGFIKKILTFDSKTYSVQVDYDVQGDFPGISVSLELPVKEHVKSSFLSPTFERQEYVVISSSGEDRGNLTPKDFSNLSFNKVELLSLGTQFFANAVIDKSTLKPNATIFIKKIDGKDKAFAQLDYEFTKDIRAFAIKQIYFNGPKDDSILQSIDSNMLSLINFGMFKVICKPILDVLKFFYSIFSNYGVAIILLTLLMRLLVFPIAYRGYKSMDKMQKIQPQLKAIKEKYKDDTQKANLETMALMKQEKVNPIGGCLPMLLQLPIFFAFYRVLSESIVMYQAPFALWIHDLSLKDPYYILPFLMGLTMFIQQKLTPTTMEPMQQKMMLFMPIVFSFFMISLPSALTLYIFVSTLFGVLQQYLFTRSK